MKINHQNLSRNLWSNENWLILWKIYGHTTRSQEWPYQIGVVNRGCPSSFHSFSTDFCDQLTFDCYGQEWQKCSTNLSWHVKLNTLSLFWQHETPTWFKLEKQILHKNNIKLPSYLSDSKLDVNAWTNWSWTRKAADQIQSARSQTNNGEQFNHNDHPICSALQTLWVKIPIRTCERTEISMRTQTSDRNSELHGLYEPLKLAPSADFTIRLGLICKIHGQGHRLGGSVQA